MNKISLFNEWNKIINSDNSLDHEEAKRVYDMLVIEYSDDLRSHHTLKHIEHLVTKLYELFKIYTFSEEEKNQCIMAGFFHDVVYSPIIPDIKRPESDEVLSAECAVTELKRIGFSDKFIDSVVQLILMTETHTPNENIDIDPMLQNAFLDADMAILGEEPFLYEQYSDGVIEEYKDIDREKFILGRKNFLSKLAKHKTIFLSEYMNQLYNDQAHTNIELEIKKMNRMYVDLLTAPEV